MTVESQRNHCCRLTLYEASCGRVWFEFKRLQGKRFICLQHPSFSRSLMHSVNGNSFLLSRNSLHETFLMEYIVVSLSYKPKVLLLGYLMTYQGNKSSKCSLWLLDDVDHADKKEDDIVQDTFTISNATWLHQDIHVFLYLVGLVNTFFVLA